MFSKEDYVKYFLQIRQVEITMRDRFGEFVKDLDDPELKKFFSALQQQERSHAKIVDGMLGTFGYKTEKK